MEIYMNPLINKSNAQSPDQLMKIRVFGLLSAVAFQKSKWCALKLFRHLSHKFTEPEIESMYQLQWRDYLEKTRRHVGGKMWLSDRPVAVFINDKYIGTDVDFVQYINERFVFHLPANSDLYETLILEDLKKFIESPKRKFVYFTLTVESEVIGSLLFMLYADFLPRTCQYFLNFCVGSGPQLPGGNRLCYKNSIIHRIVKNRWMQLGDLGVDSTIEGITVPDESYCIPHDRRGVLSLSKDQKHRNGPQFIVCLNPNPWMDKYFVAFGQLIDGDRALKKIEMISTYYESPLTQIIIADCGEYRCGTENMKIDCDAGYRDQSAVGEMENGDLVSYDSCIDSDITH